MSQLFKTQDAVKFIKNAKAGTSFRLHVRNDAPIEGEDDKAFIGCAGGYVNLSRAEAVRIVADYISPKLEERGARVPINANRYESAGKERVTYWIG
jgi:hypothetical protein